MRTYKNSRTKLRKLLTRKLNKLRGRLHEAQTQRLKQEIHADILVTVQALSDLGVKTNVPELESTEFGVVLSEGVSQ